MKVPATYRKWQEHARGLLDPLAALMQPGRADLPIQGRASDHDSQADRLESFARPLLLAAFYLQSVPFDGPGTEDAVFRAGLADWFRRGLVLGTRPDHPQYWGPDANYHQHHVEMGLMAIALRLAAKDLWEPLCGEDQQQIARWFGTSRGGGIVNNNHLFMSVHILEFLAFVGASTRSDQAVIAAHLQQLETMHRGGGWFEDGINQAYDHYNAYAFHFYGLMWVRLHGKAAPARAQRWRDWAQLFVRDYQHFFAASGELPAFGRSITYRFNAINVFGLALSEGCTELPPGLLRRLCTRNLEFFLTRPIRQEQGCLAPGFTDRFDAIVEPYSCAASPYWAAKGFTPLLLSPDHAFWNNDEQPLPAERNFVHLMPTPGLVVRSVSDGEVELLNAGSMVGNTQTRYGPWKWSKLAYRTGAQFTYAFPEASAYSCDGALTAESEDGRVFGRHSTVTLEMDADHISYTYNLGSKQGQVSTSVESHCWWRAGWLLHVHHVDARQPVRLRLGGFALPLDPDDAKAVQLSPDPIPSVSTAATPFAFFQSATRRDGHHTALQSLVGFSGAEWDNRVDDSTPRRHISAPYHATPVLHTHWCAGTVVLAALSWFGKDPAPSRPWKLERAEPGAWRLVHAQWGAWALSHPALPAIETPPT